MAEEGQGARLRRRGRVFRDRRDVLGEYSDSELLERYRFDRAGILFITDLVKEEIQSGTVRNRAISPLLKVVVTLRYLSCQAWRFRSEVTAEKNLPQMTSFLSPIIQLI